MGQILIPGILPYNIPGVSIDTISIKANDSYQYYHNDTWSWWNTITIVL